MLQIDFSEEGLTQHRDEIEAYFNIYVGHLAERHCDLEFQLIKETEKNLHAEQVYMAQFKSVPVSGKPMHINTKSRQPRAAIELCFARARRTILRESRITALT